MSEREKLKQAILAQENLRGTVDDAIIEATVAALNKQLEALADAGRVTQRKVATVLFMDTVDSTEMIRELDPEDNLAIMDRAMGHLAAPVEQYGGRVTRYMGDGFKGVFGMTIARENDPVMAVRAGLGILAAAEEYAREVEETWGIPGFRVRVGINTGLVVIGGQSEGADTLAGRAVNLAARLESSAEPGTLLISHSTYLQIRGGFDLEPHDPILVKGFPEPVPVYQVLRAKPRSFRTRGRGVEGVETRMVGRDLEMKVLQDAYLMVVEEGERQMVTLVGEAGLGKSRLLYEFEQWVDLQAQQVRLYRGRARLENLRLPYGLLRDLFAFRFAIHDDDPPEIAGKKVLAGLGEALGAGDTSEMKSDLEMRVHFVGQLLGYDFRTSPHLESVKDDPQQLLNRSLLYLTDYFKASSRQNPILVLLEDLHWADTGSLDLITRLSLALGEQPVLFVSAARPDLYERRPHWFEGRAFHRRLDLHALSRRESRHLVLEVLKKVAQVPDSLRELLVSNADGNPFYIEELVKMLVEDGVIATSAEQWQVRLDRLTDVHVPPTLTGVLQARLDRLPEEERVVLQQASVVGRVFWDAAVAHLNRSAEDGVANKSVHHELEALLKREMVYHRDLSTLAGAAEYIFRHAILREVTYESVLKNARRAYHALVADWLVEHSKERAGELTSVIAYHYREGGNRREALCYFTLAGERALDSYANHDAKTHYLAALDLTDDEGEQAGLLAQLGQSQAHLGHHADAVQTWGRAIELHLKQGDEDQAAELYARSGRAVWEGGDTKGGLEMCRQGLEVVADAPDGPGLARLLSETARACYFNGLRDEVAPLANRAMALAERFDLPAILADSLITLGTSKAANSSEGIVMLEKAIQIADSTNLLPEAMRAHNNLGVVQRDRGNSEKALESHRRTAELARQMGERHGELLTSSNGLWNLIMLGQLHAAEREYAVLIKLLGDLPETGSAGFVLQGQGAWLAFAQGDFHRGLQRSERIIQEMWEVNDLQGLYYALGYKSHLLLLVGELERAAAVVEETIQIGRSFEDGQISPYCWASVIASRRGEVQQAGESLENARKFVENEQPAFSRQVEIVRAEAHLLAARGEWEAAWGKFAENQANLTLKRWRIDLMWFGTEWAEAYLLRGKREDIVRAQELLEEAKGQAEDMGAFGWVELIERKAANMAPGT